MGDQKTAPEISVIVPVGSRHGDALALHADYRRGLDAIGRSYEIIYVLDGPKREFAGGLQRLLDEGERITVIGLTRPFGEATALMAGFERAAGQLIVTLPAYPQVESADLAKLVDSLDHCNVAVGRRWPRAGGPVERLRRRVFHGLLAWITKVNFRDLGCGARAFNRARGAGWLHAGVPATATEVTECRMSSARTGGGSFVRAHLTRDAAGARLSVRNG